MLTCVHTNFLIDIAPFRLRNEGSCNLFALQQAKHLHVAAKHWYVLLRQEGPGLPHEGWSSWAPGAAGASLSWLPAPLAWLVLSIWRQRHRTDCFACHFVAQRPSSSRRRPCTAPQPIRHAGLSDRWRRCQRCICSQQTPASCGARCIVFCCARRRRTQQVRMAAAPVPPRGLEQDRALAVAVAARLRRWQPGRQTLTSRCSRRQLHRMPAASRRQPTWGRSALSSGPPSQRLWMPTSGGFGCTSYKMQFETITFDVNSIYIIRHPLKQRVENLRRHCAERTLADGQLGSA